MPGMPPSLAFASSSRHCHRPGATTRGRTHARAGVGLYWQMPDWLDMLWGKESDAWSGTILYRLHKAMAQNRRQDGTSGASMGWVRPVASAPGLGRGGQAA